MSLQHELSRTLGRTLTPVLALIKFSASVTNQWEAVAFGGFGMAGIIAALITNPLKSISVGARRLVQVQTAYFGFLSQLLLINQESLEMNILEKSQRLEEAMSNTKVLDEHFGA